MSLNLSRQDDILPFLAMSNLKVLVIGCGGIGSNLINVLARMGVGHITVYDDQRVEDVNVAPGYFSRWDAETLKVNAVARYVWRDLKVEVTDVARRFGPDSEWSGDIVIFAVDSLKIRRDLYMNKGIDCEWLIDARMGADRSAVYVVNRKTGRGEKVYRASLRKQTSKLPCGQKATAFITAGVIPGLVGSVIYRIVNGMEPPVHMQWVPSELFFCCQEED